MKPSPLSATVCILTQALDDRVQTLVTNSLSQGIDVCIMLDALKLPSVLPAWCRQKRVQVFHRALHGDYAAQRNAALAKIDTEWTIFLDADELPSRAWWDEVITVLQQQEVVAVTTRRRDFFLGKPLRFGEAGRHAVLRIARTKLGRGKWSRAVHEVWSIPKVLPHQLHTPLDHHPAKTFSAFLEKLQRYAVLEQPYQQEKSEAQLKLELLTFPAAKFMRAVFWWQGWRDGWRGLVHAWLMSYWSFLTRLIALERARSVSGQHTPSVSMQAPHFLVMGLASLALLGQFARVSLPLGTVSLYELVMAAAIPFLAFGVWRKQGHHLEKSWPVFFALSWLIWTIFTTWLNARMFQLPTLLTTGGVYLGKLTLYLVFGWLWQWHLVHTQGLTSVTRKCLLLWLIGLTTLGIGQFLFLPDTRVFIWLGWDDHLSRAFGSLFDPGFFGALSAIGAIIVLSSAYQWSDRGKQVSQSLLLALFLIATALSFSRASYLMLLVGVIVLRLLEKRPRILLAIPLFLTTLLLMPRDGGGEGQNLVRTRSVVIREQVVEYHTQTLTPMELVIGRGWYYESARQLHALGVQKRLGTNQPSSIKPTLQRAPAVDNVWLHIFLSTGVIGSTLALMWLVSWLKQTQDPLFLAVFAGLAVHSLFSTALLYGWILLFLVLWPRKTATHS